MSEGTAAPANSDADADATASLPVSVLILTRNEERDLPGCLESVRWSDDVHIYDSFSTDGTEAIAKGFGAHWAQRNYDTALGAFGGDESEHRNWGLRTLKFRYPWVFILDADERVSESLRQAIASAVAQPAGHVAYQVRRCDIFLGRWLKHAQTTPYYVRLVRPEHLHYERKINPVTVVDGPVGTLQGALNHYPFSKGIAQWIARHNDYSSAEAQELLSVQRETGQRSLGRALWHTMRAPDGITRRRLLKQVFYRLPGRPAIRFLYLYVGRRGFLDGRAGFTYSVLQAIYEYFIVIKAREAQHSSVQD
jgi:glycosyltransferase involved in cell wall biosynthesis